MVQCDASNMRYCSTIPGRTRLIQTQRPDVLPDEEGVLERMSTDLRTDEELLLALQRKDVRALESLYERHKALAFSLALRLLGNPSDAEDVVQEAFVNVWRAAETYQAER